MIITLAVAVIIVWLAGALAYYILGNYTRANEYIVNAIKTAGAVAIPLVSLNIADKIFTALCRELKVPVSNATLPNVKKYLVNATERSAYNFESSIVFAWQRLTEVSKNFLKLMQKCADWMLWKASVTATLYASIIASPLGNVVDAACSPWETILRYSYWILFTAYVAAVILAQYYEICLVVGAALVPIDFMRLRSIGAVLYSIVLVYGPALYIWSYYAGRALANPDVANVPQLRLSLDTLGNLLSNPLNTASFVTDIAGKMARAAFEVYFVAVGTILGFSVAGALCIAVARVLGGPGARLGI